MSFLAAYIMKGRMQAMLFAATFAVISLLIPPVSILSSAAIALVTLRRGAYEGLVIMIYASAAAAVLGFLVIKNLLFALQYGLVVWLPVWLVAIVLRETQRLAFTIELAIILGSIGVVICYGINPEIALVWQGLLKQMASPVLSAQNVPLENVEQAIVAFSRLMTGIILSVMVYILIFGLFLGRWWQALLYNPGGFRTEYLNQRVNIKFTLASLMLFGLAFANLGLLSEVAQNIAVMLFLFYTVVGAAILHAYFAKKEAARFLVPMLYLTLGCIPHTMIIAVIIGLTDSWLDLRNKQSTRTGV